MDGSRDNLSYDDAVDEIARQYGVPKSVYQKMLGQESGDTDSAVSNKGAFSAWQIMPSTARGLGYDPQELKVEPLKAAEGGLRILRDNFKQFRKHAQNDLHAWMMSVAGYHGSPQNVLKDVKNGGLGIPNISDGAITTRDHVGRIFDGFDAGTLDRSPFGNVQGGSQGSQNQFATEQQNKTFVDPALIPKVSIGELPPESFLPENMRGQIPTAEPDKMPLSSFPKPEQIVSQLPPQQMPAPQGREPLPEDYQNFLKYSELTDSPEARNQYSKTVVEPMAKTEVERAAQYQRDVDSYNRSLQTQQTAPNAYEIPKNETRTAVIDQRLFNPKNEFADDENARKSIAGTASVDLSQKPKGVKLDEYLFRSAINQIGTKYNLTPEQMQTAENAIRQSAGKLLRNNYDDVTDENYDDYVNDFRQTYGSSQFKVDLTRSAINAALTGDNNAPLDQRLRDDLLKEQDDRRLNLYTSNASTGKDNFENNLTPRDSSFYQDQRNAEDEKRNAPEYELRKRAEDNIYNSFLTGGTEAEVLAEMERLKRLELSPETKAMLEGVGTIGKNSVGNYFGGNSDITSGIIGAGGGIADLIAGANRPFAALGITDSSSYEAWSKIGQGARVIETSMKRDGIGGDVLNLVGRSAVDIPKYAVMSALPGGAVVGFGLDSGLQTAGRGETVGEVIKQTAKGASLGALFNLSGNVGDKISNVLVKSVAKIGTVGVGTFTVEKGFGASDEEAFKSALMNSLFEASHLLGDLRGKFVRVWERGRAREVKIDEKRDVFLLKGLEKSPVDAELVLDPKDGTYKPKPRNEAVERQSFAEDANAIDAEFSENAKIPNSEIIKNESVEPQNQSVKNDALAAPENNFVTERQITLDAQKAAMENKNGSASAVLYTDSRTVPNFDQSKNFALETKDGVLLVNDESLKTYFKENDLGYYAREKAKYLIENKKINVNDLIGGKAFETSDTSPENNPVSLVTTDKMGNELNASVVDSPEAARKQTELDERRFGGGVESSVLPTSDVIESRIEDRPIEKSIAVLYDGKGQPQFDTKKYFLAQTKSGEDIIVNQKKMQKFFSDNKLGMFGRGKAIRLIGNGKIETSDLLGLPQPEKLNDDLVKAIENDFTAADLKAAKISANGKMNSQAFRLISDAHRIKSGASEPEVFFGSYLNPNNVTGVRSALAKLLKINDPNFEGENRLQAERILSEFDNAVDKTFGDMIQVSSSKSVPEGLPQAWEEEAFHRADYRIDKHDVSGKVFINDEIGRKAISKLRRGAYSGASDALLSIEVGAKIHRTDAEKELGLNADEVRHLKNIQYDAWIDSGKSIDEIINAMDEAKQTGRTYDGEKRPDNRGNKGNSESVNTRRKGTDERGIKEKIQGTRKSNDIARLTPNERKFIEAKTKGDTELAEKIAGEVLYSRPNASGKMTVGDYVLDVSNGIPRALKATLDLSAAGRQGLILTLSNPKAAGMAFRQQIASLFSKSAHNKFVETLETHPLARTMQETGLYLSVLADKSDLNQREEQFASRITGEDHFFANENAEAFRQGLTYSVRASERAFAGYLDKIRLESFLHMAKQVFEYNERTGIADNETYQKQLEAVAKFINIATGRGSLGAFEDHAAFLNLPFFSARNWASRVQVINPAFYWKLPPGARAAVLKSFGTFAGATALSMFLLKKSGIADIETDWNSPDFLKVRVGQYRYDIAAAIPQNLRYIAQMASAAKNLDAQGAAKTSLNYLRGKLAPLPSAIVSMATGTKINGEPTTAKAEASGLVVPISLEQLTSGAKNDGTLGALLSSPDLLGFGTSRFQNSQEIGFQLAELERQLSATLKGSDEEKELNKQVKAWRDYYEQSRKQPGELPFYIQTPVYSDDKKDDETDESAENETVIYGTEKKPERLDLREKIEFYKKNKDALFSFAKDSAEAAILQDAENMRLRGQLKKSDESAIKEIIPEWSPLRENDGRNYRPVPLKKLPKLESLPKLPKPSSVQ